MKAFFSFFGGAMGILVALGLVMLLPIVVVVGCIAVLPAVDTARKAAREHQAQQQEVKPVENSSK